MSVLTGLDGNALAGVRPLQPVLSPDPSSLYRSRSDRLLALAAGHPAERYMTFVAAVADAQNQIVVQMSGLGRPDIRSLAPIGRTDLATILDDNDLWHAFECLAANLARYDAPTVRRSAEDLLALNAADVARLCLHLLRGNFLLVDPRHAILLWAGLGAVWSQRAAHDDAPSSDHGVDAAFCPACGAPPVGSVILDGARAGLRYLHCSLCESRWHRVRARCSNCDDPRPTELWGLEDAMPAIRAESCDACRSYLKRFNYEADNRIEIVADDLGSLALDELVEAQGFGRTGLNPLSLPCSPSAEHRPASTSTGQEGRDSCSG